MCNDNFKVEKITEDKKIKPLDPIKDKEIINNMNKIKLIIINESRFLSGLRVKFMVNTHKSPIKCYIEYNSPNNKDKFKPMNISTPFNMDDKVDESEFRKIVLSPWIKYNTKNK